MPAAWVPPYSSDPTTTITGAQEPCQRPAQASVAEWVWDTSLNLCGSCRPSRAYTGLSRSSCTPACSQPSSSPIATALCIPIGRLCSHRRAHQQPDPHSCLWAQIRPCLLSPTCTTVSLAASPSNCAPAHPWPITSLHCCMPVVRPKSHSGAHWPQGLLSCPCAHSWLQPLLPVLAPATMCVFVPGHCRYTGTCGWPSQLSVCIPPALATPTACPGPLLLYLQTMLRTPTACAASEDPQDTYQGPHGCQCYGLQWPEQVRHNAPSQSHHMSPHLAPTALHVGWWRTWALPHLWLEILPYWSHSIESGRDDCFFKCAGAYARTQGSQQIRETWLYQRNTLSLQ